MAEPGSSSNGLSESAFEHGEDGLGLGLPGVNFGIESGVMRSIETGELAVVNHRRIPASRHR